MRLRLRRYVWPYTVVFLPSFVTFSWFKIDFFTGLLLPTNFREGWRASDEEIFCTFLFFRGLMAGIGGRVENCAALMAATGWFMALMAGAGRFVPLMAADGWFVPLMAADAWFLALMAATGWFMALMAVTGSLFRSIGWVRRWHSDASEVHALMMKVGMRYEVMMRAGMVGMWCEDGSGDVILFGMSFLLLWLCNSGRVSVWQDCL